MRSPAPAHRRLPRRGPLVVQDRIAQAVRNSLNLPKLRVEARRGLERGSWQVRLKLGKECSEWLTLNAGACAVIGKVSLLPPMLLGHFRLAYDSIVQTGKS